MGWPRRREPDDWGEPGKLLRRRWLQATDQWGQNYTEQLRSGLYHL